MHVTVSRSTFLSLLVFAAAAAIGLGVAGHSALLSVSEASASERKALAERLLFAGLSGSLVVLAIGAFGWLRSIYLTHRLDKLAEMSRMAGYSPEPALRRLGEVGERIAALYGHILRVSDRKTDKIYAQSAVNEGVLSLCERPLLLMDAGGEILRMNRAFLDRFELTRGETVGTNASSLFPDVDLPGVLGSMERSRDPAEGTHGDEQLRFLPYHDRSGELAYCLCVVGPLPEAGEPSGAGTGRS